MDKIAKISQHHCKERLKANKVAKFMSDLLKATKIQVCKITKFYRCEYVTSEMGFQVNNDLIYIC